MTSDQYIAELMQNSKIEILDPRFEGYEAPSGSPFSLLGIALTVLSLGAIAGFAIAYRSLHKANPKPDPKREN